MAVATTILHYTLATAGHAGHGKTALVKAIAGVTPQSGERQISAGIDLPVAVARFGKLELAIVDPPGQQDRVGDLLAAASGVRLVLFVVAADQGWMAQTEEHLQILTYLGIHRAVFALTRIDKVKDPASIAAEVKGRLSGSAFAKAPVVATSVMRASTIVNLRKTIVDALGRVPIPGQAGKPRMTVDCLYPAPGGGVIAGGALRGGNLAVGQEILIIPSGAKASIAAAQSHNRQLQTARSGWRVDLSLAGLDPGGDGAIAFGSMITIPGVECSTTTFDVQLTRLPRSIDPDDPPPPLSQDQLVQVHCSAAMPARVHLLDVERLAVGEKALARLTFDKPRMALPFDRIVLRDESRGQTLAGGIVLDADPPPTAVGPSLQRQLILLRLRADSPRLPGNYISSQLARDGVARRADLLLRSPFSKTQMESAIDGMLADKSVLALEDILADASWWQQLRGVIEAAIDQYHRDHPDRAGLPLTELRPLAAVSLPPNVEPLSRPVIDALLEELCAGDFARTAAAIARRGHQAGPSPHMQAAAQALLRRLDESSLDPPPRAELSQGRAQAALKLLLDAGQAIDLGVDVVLSAQAYADAVETIRQRLRDQGPATTSELTELLGSTRRVIVPLLAKLDRENVTRKEGTRRHLIA